jgi:hypothetical protein
MKDNTTKLIATIIGTAVIAVGGTYTLTENQVGSIEAELAAKTEQLASTTAELNVQNIMKIDIGKDFVYSQITSGRIPNFAGNMNSTDISLSYIMAYYEKAGAQAGDALVEKIKNGEAVNLTTELKLLAEQKGEMLTCTK